MQIFLQAASLLVELGHLRVTLEVAIALARQTPQEAQQALAYPLEVATPP